MWNLSRFAGVSVAKDPSVENWRRGWDLNPRMEVLQTSPLNLLGTAPLVTEYSETRSACQGAGRVTLSRTASRRKRADSSGGVGQI